MCFFSLLRHSSHKVRALLQLCNCRSFFTYKVRRFRPRRSLVPGTPSMVGWWGWRKRATTTWRLWSVRLRQRPKEKEPSPEPASTTGVPAERDAVLHSLAALQNGDHALERASAKMRVDREGARGPSPQFDRVTKGACALQYGWAGLRVGLTSRRAAPLPKAPPKASLPKAPLPKAPLPKAPLQPGRPRDPAAAHARCVRHIHVDIRVPDCVQLPCVDIHVPDTV